MLVTFFDGVFELTENQQQVGQDGPQHGSLDQSELICESAERDELLNFTTLDVTYLVAKQRYRR
jgi:hypothetical protein